MQEDVAAELAKCSECRAAKGPLEKTRVPLKLFRGGTLHGRWHVDLAGPLPATEEGYKYVMVAIDAFSGWPVTVPLKTQTAKEIAEALINHVFSVYGAPIAIRTDQGKNFESELFQEILDIYQVTRQRVTAFHPSANGKVERWIRTMKQMIRLIAQNARDDWIRVLPFIAQAYRNLPHPAHGYSPYEIMFGAKMRTPLCSTREVPPHLPDVGDFPLEVRSLLQKIHEEVRTLSGDAANKMKNYYDRTAGLAPFKVNDKVFLHNKVRKTGESDKLRKVWLGPFTVKTVLNDCIAKIQEDAKPSNVQIVHMDRLAPYPVQAEAFGAWLNFHC